MLVRAQLVCHSQVKNLIVIIVPKHTCITFESAVPVVSHDRPQVLTGPPPSYCSIMLLSPEQEHSSIWSPAKLSANAPRDAASYLARSDAETSSGGGFVARLLPAHLAPED